MLTLLSPLLSPPCCFSVSPWPFMFVNCLLNIQCLMDLSFHSPRRARGKKE